MAMGLALVLLILTLYAGVALFLFVGVGYLLWGYEGSLVGYVLCIMIAGCGGAYIVATTCIGDSLSSLAAR